MSDWVVYGALLISGISLIWNIIIWRKQKKFDSRISKSNFVSQTRFSAEFKMYQDLMEKLGETVSFVAAFSFSLTIGEDYLTKKQEQYENAYKSWEILKTAVMHYAPFVDKITYDKLNKLLDDLVNQIVDTHNVTLYNEDIELKDRSKHRQAIIDRGAIIKTDFDNFVDDLRESLAKRETI
jgi:hypothetical protein